MSLSFSCSKFSVTDRLPRDWQKDVSAVADEADFRDFPRTPILSREAADVMHITRGRVHADKVQQSLPWLYKLYRSDFLSWSPRPAGNPSRRHSTIDTASS